MAVFVIVFAVIGSVLCQDQGSTNSYQIVTKQYTFPEQVVRHEHTVIQEPTVIISRNVIRHVFIIKHDAALTDPNQVIRHELIIKQDPALNDAEKATRHEFTVKPEPGVNATLSCPQEQHKQRIPRPPIGERQKLESPRITNWGSWGDWADCGEDRFVDGMKLKVQSDQFDGDDTALNAIRLTCSAPNSQDNNEIQSLEGKLGEFGSNCRCPGNNPAIGFQLRSLKHQGGDDDTAANNFRLICENETLEGDGMSAGDWSEPQICKNDEALCGFRTQVESPGAPIAKRQKLESPRITNWGSWGDWADCGEDRFVSGMQLKVQADQSSGDDTALNAIRLTCSASNSQDSNEIQSLDGKLGEFGSNCHCPGNRPAIGFQLRSLKNQGGGDDTAANNFRLICENETLEGDGLSGGEWSESQICKNDEALCGFRTQVESPGGDETSLNNIDMVCCK